MKNLKSSVKNILSVAVTAVLLLNTTVSLSAEENQKDSGEISVAYNYTDENGNIITDGYGYIDPYTGSYIN